MHSGKPKIALILYLKANPIRRSFVVVVVTDRAIREKNILRIL